MRVAEKAVQRRVALALAHLCSPDDQRAIFINNSGMSYSYYLHAMFNFRKKKNLTIFIYLSAGLDLLLGLLGSSSPKQQLDGAIALYRLANKATILSPVDAAPPSPTPQVCFLAELFGLLFMHFVLLCKQIKMSICWVCFLV
jgi:ABC-type branched-subunit amino acid transport system permease subunit